MIVTLREDAGVAFFDLQGTGVTSDSAEFMGRVMVPRGAPKRILVDFENVTRLDARNAAAIAMAIQGLLTEGHDLKVVCPAGGEVYKALAEAKFVERFKVYGTLSEAMDSFSRVS